jgi:hypothetical protein
MAVAGHTQAGIVFFNNQATWQAAAGPASFTEDFSGFATDTLFQTSPVALNGMSIVQQGANAAFRNFIDVAPFQFLDNNGTSHASAFTEGDAGTFVRITFNNPTQAFGFQTWDAATGEGAALEVFNGTTLLGSITLPGGLGAFTGFMTTGGDVATSVRFSPASADGTSGGEGFGLDNLAAVNATAVPEPATLTVFGGLLVAGLVSMRRRRTS